MESSLDTHSDSWFQLRVLAEGQYRYFALRRGVHAWRTFQNAAVARRRSDAIATTTIQTNLRWRMCARAVASLKRLYERKRAVAAVAASSRLNSLKRSVAAWRRCRRLRDFCRALARVHAQAVCAQALAAWQYVLHRDAIAARAAEHLARIAQGVDVVARRAAVLAAATALQRRRTLAVLESSVRNRVRPRTCVHRWLACVRTRACIREFAVRIAAQRRVDAMRRVWSALAHYTAHKRLLAAETFLATAHAERARLSRGLRTWRQRTAIATETSAYAQRAHIMLRRWRERLAERRRRKHALGAVAMCVRRRLLGNALVRWSAAFYERQQERRNWSLACMFRQCALVSGAFSVWKQVHTMEAEGHRKWRRAVVQHASGLAHQCFHAWKAYMRKQRKSTAARVHALQTVLARTFRGWRDWAHSRSTMSRHRAAVQHRLVAKRAIPALHDWRRETKRILAIRTAAVHVSSRHETALSRNALTAWAAALRRRKMLRSASIAVDGRRKSALLAGALMHWRTLCHESVALSAAAEEVERAHLQRVRRVAVGALGCVAKWAQQQQRDEDRHLSAATNVILRAACRRKLQHWRDVSEAHRASSRLSAYARWHHARARMATVIAAWKMLVQRRRRLVLAGEQVQLLTTLRTAHRALSTWRLMHEALRHEVARLSRALQHRAQVLQVRSFRAWAAWSRQRRELAQRVLRLPLQMLLPPSVTLHDDQRASSRVPLPSAAAASVARLLVLDADADNQTQAPGPFDALRVNEPDPFAGVLERLEAVNAIVKLSSITAEHQARQEEIPVLADVEPQAPQPLTAQPAHREVVANLGKTVRRTPPRALPADDPTTAPNDGISAVQRVPPPVNADAIVSHDVKLHLRHAGEHKDRQQGSCSSTTAQLPAPATVTELPPRLAISLQQVMEAWKAHQEYMAGLQAAQELLQARLDVVNDLLASHRDAARVSADDADAMEMLVQTRIMLLEQLASSQSHVEAAFQVNEQAGPLVQALSTLQDAGLPAPAELLNRLQDVLAPALAGGASAP